LSGAWWVRNGERCGKSEKREFHGEFSSAILLRKPWQYVFGRGNYTSGERRRVEI
jgi:hypothetical protein